MKGYLVGAVSLSGATILLALQQIWRSPRQRKRTRRKMLLWFVLPVNVLGATALLVTPRLTGRQLTTEEMGAAAFLLFCLAVSAYSLNEEFTERQMQANYAKDPGHCGRCEYDMTGNVSGVCPECGWKIPDLSKPAGPEAPPKFIWALRRIEHLDDWRKTLRQSIAAMVIVSCQSAIVAVTCSNRIVTIVLSAMTGLGCVLLLVFVGRVISYGRRQGHR